MEELVQETPPLGKARSFGPPAFAFIATLPDFRRSYREVLVPLTEGSRDLLSYQRGDADASASQLASGPGD